MKLRFTVSMNARPALTGMKLLLTVVEYKVRSNRFVIPKVSAQGSLL